MSKSKGMFARLAAVTALVLAGAQAHAQPGSTTIVIGTGSGPAGGTASFTVSLDTQDAVAGTQNNITFDADVAIAAKANLKPDCKVNDAINKGGTSFAFQPPGCSGTACTAVKALVLALDNVCPVCGTSTIPGCTGLPTCPVDLYTCNVTIAATATGDHALTCSAAQGSTPDGMPITANCTDGGITVGGGGGPTPTSTPPTGPTATATPVASGAATATATHTSGVIVPTGTATSGGTGGATATATGSRAATATPTGGTAGATATATGSRVATATVTGSRAVTPTRTPLRTSIIPKASDDDACAIVSPAASASGWMLLLPAAALLWIRRRR
jgi:carbon monoxide dehydrogenase subunit G